MPRQKGTPKTGGRVKGTPNRNTAERLESARALARRVLGDEVELIDPWVLLQIAVSDPTQPMALRGQWALGMLPYIRPRLAATAVVSKHIDGDDVAFGKLFAEIEQRLALAPPERRTEVIDMLRADETEESE